MQHQQLTPRSYNSLASGAVVRGPSHSRPSGDGSHIEKEQRSRSLQQQIALEVDTKIRDVVDTLRRSVETDVQRATHSSQNETRKELSKTHETLSVESKQLRSDLSDARKQIEELSIRFEMERHTSAEQRHLLAFLMNKQGANTALGSGDMFEAGKATSQGSSLTWQIAEYVYLILISLLRAGNWLLQPVIWAFSSLSLVGTGEEGEETGTSNTFLRHMSAPSSRLSQLRQHQFQTTMGNIEWRNEDSSVPLDARLVAAFDASVLGTTTAQRLYNDMCARANQRHTATTRREGLHERQDDIRPPKPSELKSGPPKPATPGREGQRNGQTSSASLLNQLQQGLLDPK